VNIATVRHLPIPEGRKQPHFAI